MSQAIKKIAVEGLQGIFDYEVTFPDGADTVIIIAPNGYGKTALLSLIKDSVSLSLRRVAAHTFKTLEITFHDKTKWRFDRFLDEDRIQGRRMVSRSRRIEGPWGNHIVRAETPCWVTLTRFDKKGKKIENGPLNSEGINSRILMRAIDRMPFLSIETPREIKDFRTGELLSIDQVLDRYYLEIMEDVQVTEMISASSPSAIWPGIKPIECVFIETQRLLYSKSQTQDGGEKGTHQEEILRQAADLAGLLQKNYSDYAAISQGLDRSFPNRLIARARDGASPNADQLQKDLIEIETQRKALTEAGILFEQADALISTDDALVPKVLDALQIYVEDSQKKLKTYDDIFPKISAFRALLSNKLRPKILSISRDKGASISRDGQQLKLEGLSSGEKHEFIMLYKLIFETKSDSLVLIDEPEISLHVVWQLEFMSDLQRVQSANPFQSIIATHSPQIFQGFEHLVVDLAGE